MRLFKNRELAAVILRDFSGGRPFAMRDVFARMGFKHYHADGARTRESQATSNVLRGFKHRGMITFKPEEDLHPTIGHWFILDEAGLRRYAEGGRLPPITREFKREARGTRKRQAPAATIAPPATPGLKVITIEDVKEAVVKAADKLTVPIVTEILQATAACRKVGLVPPERFLAVIDALRWRVKQMEKDIQAEVEAKIAKTPVTHEEMAAMLRTVEERQNKFEHKLVAALGELKRDIRPLTEMVEAADSTYKEVLQKLNTMGAKLEAQHKSLQDARARLVEAELKLSGKAADPEEVEIEHARLHDPRYTPAEQNTIMNGRGGY